MLTHECKILRRCGLIALHIIWMNKIDTAVLNIIINSKTIID